MSYARRKLIFTAIMAWPLRLWVAARYLGGRALLLTRWLIGSREYTNFTYYLDDLNERYMANFLSIVTAKSEATILGYIAEIKGDAQLRNHLFNATRDSPYRLVTDKQPKYGRRIGWYALARAIKPEVVVETGVDKGLGSCVLAAALRRNSLEGWPGYLYGTDINPRSGYLLGEPYSQYGKVIYGDSIESLIKLNCSIDLFINDSNHTSDYEMKEYAAVMGKLSRDAILVGDNAHCSDSLLTFANETNRKFLFYGEKPKNHWYEGAGMGCAYRSPARDAPSQIKAP
jgi:hypothetical protein